MRTFFAAVLLAAFCFPAEAAFRDEAFLTVRPMAGGPTNGDIFCSAVVVEPGRAYTAAHCIDASGFMVDGLPAVSAKIIIGTDAAVVEVPGLACPCAKVDTRPVPAGTVARAVGYPGVRNDGKPIERHTTGPMTITGVSTAAPFYPAGTPMSSTRAMTFLYMTPGLIENGQSGGGTFIHRDGRWVLVATNSVGLCPKPYGWCKQEQEIASGSTPVATHQK